VGTQAPLARPTLACGLTTCELYGEEQQQPVIAFEEVDHERCGRTGLAPTSTWLHRMKAPWFDVRQRFCGRGVAKAGVRTLV